MRFLSYFFAASIAMGVACLSTADAATVSGVPTTWRLQNYAPNNVVLWYTGSTCTTGKLVFQTGTSPDDTNRLWSMVLSAKLAQCVVNI